MKINKTVFSIIKENIDYGGEIKLRYKLVEDLEIDSFDKLMIINSLEDEFCIEIEEDDIKDLITVSDVVEGIKKYIYPKQTIKNEYNGISSKIRA